MSRSGNEYGPLTDKPDWSYVGEHIKWLDTYGKRAYTVEPLSKGHIGTSFFFHYREVLFSEV